MGRDKATVMFDGQTLVERMVSAVSPRCAPVFVVAAPGQALPTLDAHILRDDIRGVGPLLATGRGLRAAAEAGLELAFVCAVDMPLLSADLIDELEGPAVRLGADVVLPWDGRSMRALVESVDTQRVVMPEQAALTNVNTVAELRATASSRIA